VDVTKDHNEALRQRPWRFPVSGRPYQPDRGGAVGGWIAGLVFPGILLLEQRSRQQDAWDCELLSPRRVHEPQSL